MSVSQNRTDAGLREQDHYKSRLPWWRSSPRQWLLPIVRYETPYVAALQEGMRTPSLDAYFSITANLGTHTFFMIFLPVLIWCGNPILCRGLVHILAAGVYITGFIKDLLCLPRPLSPPLQRISMSKGAALEYGFPSTHSANALSVAVYALLALNDERTVVDPKLKLGLEIFAGTYAVSIALGRLYCGMHGFLDVFIGSAIGALISLVQYSYIEAYDNWLLTTGPTAFVIELIVVVALIRIHPEPADDCPCFDDSVSFAGVVFGFDTGVWFWYHAHGHSIGSVLEVPVPYDFQQTGLIMTLIRTVVGVCLILGWRKIAKAVSLAVFPPFYRIISKAGFLLPRRFFKQAPEYDKIPANVQMDTLIPPFSRLPGFVQSIVHPRKNRSVSVGPQSYADAYETLAYRQKVRRESQSKLTSPGPMVSSSGAKNGSAEAMSNYFSEKPVPARSSLSTGQTSGAMPPTPVGSNTNLKDQAAQLEPGPAVLTPLTPGDSASGLRSRDASADRREREEDRKEEQAVFASLPKPRTKFDIEIVTKLIVYSGIGLFARGLIPYFFEVVGLA